jgi:hypothetical protein
MAAAEQQLTAPAAASADAIPLRLRRSGGTPRQVLAASLIGAVVLALFASRDLPSWSERLGGGTIAQRIQGLAGEWDQALDGLGLTRPHEALRDAVRRLLDWQWGS